MKIPLIVIGGPTASGKTALAVKLAQRLGGEIVSADSMQVYKSMDIGTAKPTLEERAGIAHYLLDEIEPDEPFSVAQYAQRAHEAIRTIHEKGKLPILAGGTGLYIDAVIRDMDFGEIEVDYALRDELERIAEQKGADYLHRMLAEFDPETAEKYHANNVKRIVRAIEFYKTTGETLSAHQKRTKKESRYDVCFLAVEWDRRVLYERIEQRVELMLREGLIDEVKGLVARGYTKRLVSMQGIGYKEVIDYLRGLSTYDEMVRIVKRDTRRYAKRQLTWFRREEGIHWIKYGNNMVECAIEIIKR